MIDWRALSVGNHRLPCPECGRGPRDRTLGVTVDHDGSGVGHCFRCQYIEANREERTSARAGRLISGPPRAAKRETLSSAALAFWTDCSPPAGPARAYLTARGCAIPPDDGDLRWHPQLKHPPSGYVGPALVALVSDAVTRKPLTLHRTWIRADGTKAAVNPPRMLLGGHRKAGGVIRLWPDEAVTTGLAIAEGVETSLSVARDFRPAWAAVDAGNLAAFPVLAGIETLVVAADHDAAGIEAANKCADRWAAAGVDVRVLAPVREHADWNDRAAA